MDGLYSKNQMDGVMSKAIPTTGSNISPYDPQAAFHSTVNNQLARIVAEQIYRQMICGIGWYYFFEYHFHNTDGFVHAHAEAHANGDNPYVIVRRAADLAGLAICGALGLIRERVAEEIESEFPNLNGRLFSDLIRHADFNAHYLAQSGPSDTDTGTDTE